ncbi:MAG: hypothetical protein L0211_10505 [Planctomycetaceae bacterium]|nr:hypothetical protein [Planctomycetaceae bacterium]
MTRPPFRLAALSVAVLLFVGAARADERAKSADPAVFGVLVGSTPCGESIRTLFKLPENVELPLRWKLTLRHDPQSHAPTRYFLRCDYQTTGALIGSAKKDATFTKEGAWRLGKGTKSNPKAVVYQLDGDMALAQIDRNVAQLLNPDRSLMIGTGGWSYTLCRADAAETPVDPALANTVPDMSYTISPVATGDNVFGVFEGRTPYQGIARDLGIEPHPGGNKAKWRVTLYQDPKSKAPTTYKVEGTLFKATGAREGKWTMARGTADEPDAAVFELAATKTQAAILLLAGDDNVLFFLDHDRKPLVGHADFSYTLNRRPPAGQP